VYFDAVYAARAQVNATDPLRTPAPRRSRRGTCGRSGTPLSSCSPRSATKAGARDEIADGARGEHLAQTGQRGDDTDVVAAQFDLVAFIVRGRDERKFLRGRDSHPHRAPHAVGRDGAVLCPHDKYGALRVQGPEHCAGIGVFDERRRLHR
jgi:hypothetical protein